MKNELEMKLFSRHTLTEPTARRQITALSDFGGGLMRPDKWGKAEPIRAPFDPADISAPIQWLIEPHGEFFYRKGRPAHVSGEMWGTGPIHPPLASHHHCLPIIGLGDAMAKWATRIGIGKVEEFVCEMFRVTARTLVCHF